jgi:curli biogenesis system outer membrane secretion channel CsgG
MRAYVALLGAVLAITPVFGQQAPQEKRRVAVMDFGYGAVMSSVQALFGTTQDVGRGISDLIIDRLINDGTYRVIERRDLDKLLQEQNFSNSDRADAATAAKIGRLLGVDTIITGDITQFGRDDRNVGGGGSLGRWDKYGIGNVGVRKAKAVVGITARMVDVNTGEILASVSGRGESTRSGTNLVGAGGGWANSGSGQLDMSSSNFSQTILGEAVKAAVTQVSSQLEQNASRLPHETVQIKGLVADASGNNLIINVGSSAGVHVGDKLAVTRVSREIKDPVTGKLLRTVEEPVGELSITSVDQNSAEGRFTGSGQPKVGDAVKTIQPH